MPFRLGMVTNAVRYCRSPSARIVPKSGVMISARCQGASRSGWPARAPAVWRRWASKNSSTRRAGALALSGGSAAATGWRLGSALTRGKYSESTVPASVRRLAREDQDDEADKLARRRPIAEGMGLLVSLRACYAARAFTLGLRGGALER